MIHAEQAREAANIRRWRTVEGNWSEQSVEKVSVRKRILFSSGWASQRIEAHKPTRTLLEKLIGLCFSLPEYLCREDAARYIALVQELKEFHCEMWHGTKRIPVKVEDLPICDLGRAIGDWILSYFDDKRCLLLPAYALDTAMFIEAHMAGHHTFGPKPWEIEPMVESIKRDFQLDARFKSQFTSRISGTIVRCKIPQGCSIEFQQKTFVASGQEFCAFIKRCHLSSNFQDGIVFQTQIPEAETIDLGFQFVGDMLLMGESSLMDWLRDSESNSFQPVLLPESMHLFHDCRLLDINLPANWIQAVGRYDNGEVHLQPVPRWEAEIGNTRHGLTESLSSTIQ
ncbi:MAG TPA: hypothetical protein VJW20_07355 [Candidatus Angelobacter sp.]|nr:hypothetical protein [Candidatus Angelobacter sp.]